GRPGGGGGLHPRQRLLARGSLPRRPAPVLRLDPAGPHRRGRAAAAGGRRPALRGSWMTSGRARGGPVVQEDGGGAGEDGPSLLTPVVQESTPSMIATRLREAIAAGELAPGSRLSEARLAARL